MTERDWTPVRRGEIYCSPACGGRCTWAAHQAAKVAAVKLAIRLGNGWNTHVSENLGWHYCAISPCRRITVSEYGKKSYSALLGEAGSFAGRYVGQGKNPRAAVVDAVNAAKADLAEIGAFITGLERYDA